MALHRSEFPIHVHGPVFMALCRLSRVPWSEVESQTSPLSKSFRLPLHCYTLALPWLDQYLKNIQVFHLRLFQVPSE